MKKQDSLQTAVINAIKKEVKKDLDYFSLKKAPFESDGVIYYCSMHDPESKYGVSFVNHVVSWASVMYNTDSTIYLGFNGSRCINDEDKAAIDASVKKWVEKMMNQCLFI